MAVAVTNYSSLLVLLASGCVASSCTDLTVLDQKDPDDPLPTRRTSRRWGHFDFTARTALVRDSLRLTATVPVTAEDCEEELGLDPSPCRDADGDGLSDLWERIALHRLRPFVRMHPEEPLFRDHHGRVVASGRVTRTSLGQIRIFLPIIFSNDYGRCGATEHRGDPERIALDLVPLDSTTVEVIGAYTASHENTTLDGSRLLDEQDLSLLEYATDELTGMPRWVVYSSIGKHAMYPNTAACGDQGFLLCTTDDCASSGDARNDLLPDVYNVGEPDSLDFSFEGSDQESRHRESTPPPRRDQVWGGKKYCGGLSDEEESYSGSCAGPIRDKLIDDPFR